jgi:hypothetical protein
MNEIELFQLGIREYKKSQKILKLNEELLLYLHGSIKQVLRDVDKHNIHLKNRDKLNNMIEKSIDYLDEIENEASKSELGIFNDDPSTENQQEENNRRRHRTENE